MNLLPYLTQDIMPQTNCPLQSVLTAASSGGSIKLFPCLIWNSPR